MKRFLIFSFFLVCVTFIQAQNKNIQLLGQLPYTNSTLHGRLSDVWGHVDTAGNEYAIVGLQRGVSIVDVTDPTTPTEVFYVSGASSIWRDIKTWNNHAYITNETSGGLMIIDMSALPGTITSSDVYTFGGTSYPFYRAHNLYIDEKGVAYVFGSNYSARGAIFLDLTQNPKIPTEAGVFDSLYLHDGMTRGDTMWGAAVYAGQFYAVDVSNKANPTILASKYTSGFFAHNCWISDDGNTLFTTDEISGGAVGSYDVSNLLNIDEIDIIFSNPGSGVIPHNAHVYGDFVVTSYYRDGVTVVDASQPDRMVEVGNYDTSPIYSGNGFNGCWGAYPYLPSGNLLATDIENGLFVLGVDYVKGVYLKGKTKRFSDSNNLSQTRITSIFTGDSLFSNLIGNYRESFVDSGLYRFVFEKVGYFPDTVDVYMTSGQMHTVDVYLRSIVPFKLRGYVKDINSSNPIENAEVLIEGKYNNYTTTTDASGYFEINAFYEGRYDVSVGKWTYKTNCYDLAISPNDTLKLFIGEDHYDDMTFDYNWDTINGGSNGYWERENFRYFKGDFSIDFPIEDVNGDCVSWAYVTGNSNGIDHDVDGAWNELISPSFDVSSFSHPIIKFSYWFKNDAVSGTEDSMVVCAIIDLDTIKMLDINNAVNLIQSSWVDTSLHLTGLSSNYSDVRLFVKIGDFGTDDLLEAGIDHVRIVEGYVGTQELTTSDNFDLFPNPSDGFLFYQSSKDFQPVRYRIYNTNGMIVQQDVLDRKRQGQIKLHESLPNGMYLIQFYSAEGDVKSRRVLKKKL